MEHGTENPNCCCDVCRLPNMLISYLTDFRFSTQKGLRRAKERMSKNRLLHAVKGFTTAIKIETG